MELSQVLEALKRADAAGAVDDARELAQIAQSLMAKQPAPVEEQPRQNTSSSGDLGTAFKQGMAGSAQALTNVAGADNAASRYLGGVSDRAQQQYSPARQVELQAAQERMKAAEESGSFSREVGAAVTNIAEAPLQATAQGLGSLAVYVPTMLLGKVGALLGLGTRAVAALTTVANQAPKVLGTAQGAGAVKGAIFDATLQAEMADGVPEAKAREKALKAQEYMGENLDQILIGGGVGGVAASFGPEKLFTPKGVAGAPAGMAKRVAGTVAAEMPLEGAQGGQERMAANISQQRQGRDVGTFTGVAGAATQEALTAGLAAGPVAALRGPARPPAGGTAEERQAAQRQREQERQGEEKRRQSPEYLMELDKKYEQTIQQLRELDKVIKTKPDQYDLDAQTLVRDARAEKKALMESEDFRELRREHSAAKPRIAGLKQSPEEFMMGQLGSDGTNAERRTPRRAGALYPDGVLEPEAAPTDEVQAWARQRVEWALDQPQTRKLDQGGVDDLAELFLEDPKRAAEFVQRKPNIPGLKPSMQTALVRKVGKGLGAIEASNKQMATQANQSAQARMQGLKDTEAEALATERADTERSQREAQESEQRSAGLTDEMRALQRMGQKPGPYTPTPGTFSGNPTELVQTGNPAVGQAAQQLGGQTRGLDLQFNEDRNRALGPDAVGPAEPAVTGPARRAEGGFRLFNAQGEPDADTGFRPIQQRIARLLASPNLTDEAYALLRQVEDVMPKVDSQVEELRKGRTLFSSEQDTAGMGMLYDALDQQLSTIERGEQGVIQEGQPRYSQTSTRPAPDQYGGASAAAINPAFRTDVAAVQSGQQPKNPTPSQPKSDMRSEMRPGTPETRTARREPATTGRTLRGPSASVRPGNREQNLPDRRGGLPLDVPRMLRDRLSDYANAGQDSAGQQSLFADADKELGNIKDSPEAFKRFMNSPFVRKMRKNLRKALGLVAKGPSVTALKKRAGALAKKVAALQSAAARYKGAQQTLKNAKMLAGLEVDAQRLGARMTELVVDRMQLRSVLDTARQDEAVFARATEDARGTPVFKSLYPELVSTRKRLELLESELGAVDTVLATLDAQLKVAKATSEMAGLRENAPFPYEVDAAQAALQEAHNALSIAQQQDSAERRQRLAEDAAERREQDATDAEKMRRLKAKQDQAAQKRVEAMYNNLKEGTESRQIEALDDAQRNARERLNNGEKPELTAKQRIEVQGDPLKVLGGYRSKVRNIEKAIQTALKKSRGFAGTNLEKMRATHDKLYEAYKAAKSADQRAEIGVKYDEAAAALREAEQRFKGESVMWPGAKKMLADLDEATFQMEWLEQAMANGEFEVVDARQANREALSRAAAQQRRSEQNTAEAEAGASRADAPSTSGEAGVTRTEAKKRTTPTKSTGYKSKDGLSQKEQFDQVVKDFDAAKKESDRIFNAAPPAEDPKKQTVRKPVKVASRPVNALTEAGQEALLDGRLPDLLEDLAQNGHNKFVRSVAQALQQTLGKGVKLRAVQDLKDDEGTAVEGSYDSATRTIYIDANALTEEVVLHETVHAATLSALDTPDSGLTPEQVAAKKRLLELYNAIRKDPEFKGEYANRNLKEFVSELMSNQQVRDKLANTKPTILKRIYGAFMSLFKMKDVRTAAVADVFQLFMPPVKYSSLDGDRVNSIMRGNFPGLNTSAAPNTPTTISSAADSIVGDGSPSWWQSIQANAAGLAARTQFLDQYAPVEELIRKGVAKGQLDSLRGFQTMFYLRFGQQRNQFMSQVATQGPLSLVKNDDGSFTYEAKEGANLKRMAELLGRIEGNTPERTEAEFTAFLAIRRALQSGIGFDKLNTKEPMNKAQATAFMREVDADPARKAAFEAAADEYRAYNKGLLDFMVQTGTMEAAEATRLGRLDYVPYYRARNGVAELIIAGERPVRIGNLADQPYLKELIGNDEKILPVFTGALQNTSMLLGMGLRNQSMKDTAYMLKQLDIGKVLTGDGPRGPSMALRTIRFKEKGVDKFIVLDQEAMDAFGVPADLLVKGLEGIKTTVPFIVKAMGGFSSLLRTAVTRNPAYAIRQVFRDSMNGWLVTGGDFTPVLSSMAELAKMQGGRSPNETVLERAGAVSSNVITGDKQDWPRILREVSAGKTPVGMVLAKADAFAIQGDTATRAVLYQMYRDRGMTHMEALLGSLESMNFNRRGVSPTMQFMSMMIPFFNAQIQGMDVIYRASRGRGGFEEQMEVRRKLLVRGAMMTAATLAYAAAMQDDEAYKNASDQERAQSYFVYVPGFDEPVRVPIPFELGYAFKAVPELIFNAMANDKDAGDVAKAVGELAYSSIPFGIPQAIKPAIEAQANHSFFTGQSIVGPRESGLDPEKQFRQNTSELSKLLGSTAGVSPLKIEHMIRGYMGGLGVLGAQMLNPLFDPLTEGDVPAPARKKVSEMPLLGSLFQPKDGRGAINEAYEVAQEMTRRAQTYKSILASGNRAEALAYAQRYANEIAGASVAGKFRQQMGEFAAARRTIQADRVLTPDQKRERLDALRVVELAYARRLKALDKTKPQ